MPSSSFDLWQVVRDFVLYGVVANLLIVALPEIVGDKIRFKIRFYKKRLYKWSTGLVTEIRIGKSSTMRIVEK